MLPPLPSCHKITLLLLCFLVPCICMAGHIAGGEMYYKYIGAGSAPNTNRYEITLRLFRQCNPPAGGNGQRLAPLPMNVLIGIFDAGTSNMILSQTVNRSNFTTVSLQSPLVCIKNVRPGEICYEVATFTFQQDLPINAAGYVLAYQTCCRSNSLVNIQKFPISNQNSGEGATYVCEIPGTDVMGTATNSSAVFDIKDTVLICQYKNMKLDFSATDPDGDSLSYSFCGAYNRGNAMGADNNTPPSNPPYQEVTYLPGYAGSQPLGNNITINPVTGIISGRAPANGGYVVNVCITEWRKGKAISQHRKDFLVEVKDCDFAAADLMPVYTNCTDSTVYFENQSTSSAITSYFWDFGVTNSSMDTSNQPTPAFTYPDTGTYTMKLVINKGQECTDSAAAQVKIYPGFVPDFGIQGSCLQNPYRFSDSTKATYGVVNSWSWNFGVANTLADTSHQKNPAYQYNAIAVQTVQLIVGSSKGCLDTVSKQVDVRDKPLVNLAFRDTLICSIDTLPLKVNGMGNFSWTPVKDMLFPNTSSPLVFPKDTITYIVTLNDNGCINSDSVRVNVLDFITVQLPTDTTICTTDSFRLQPVSQGLQYQWTPATGLNDAGIKYPTATPPGNITYQVTASLGKCQATGQERVQLVPYPRATIFPDSATICYNTSTQLLGTINGSRFVWSPGYAITNGNTLSPTVTPLRNTLYKLAAYDTLGCPKPGYDSVLVKVRPRVLALAGNDTAVVTGQPLQLNATGGTNYFWTPPLALSNRSLSNPVALFNASLDSMMYTVRVSTPEGCYADDSIKIKIFRPDPEIYVPSAFTPNNDGRNDVLRPISPGIRQLNFFRIYSRWGQLLFSTSEYNKGWDGTFSGRAQPGGTYVYIVEAIDYRGRRLARKGTIVLIR